jgi:predicted DNA-binding transcriptional regulator AlpA
MNLHNEESLLRLTQIIGQKEVTPEQAKQNRKRMKGPRIPRPAISPIIPVSKSAWWAGVKSHKYPQPIKLGGRVTAWRRSEIMALILKEE